MASADDIRERTREWVAAGIIQPAQADRIAAFEHDRDQHAAGVAAAVDARSRLQAVFGVLGGVLVGLGLLLTAATNWDHFTDTLKVAIIVAGMVVAYAVALVADGRGAPRWAGSVAWLVGVGIFAGGLAVLADVYNVDAHEPLLVLLVALAATTIALLAERLAVGWIAGAAVLGWIGWELGASLDALREERFAPALASCLVLVGIAGLATSFVVEALSQRAQRSSAAHELARRMHVLVLPLRSVALLLLLGVLVQATFAWHWHWELDAVPPRAEQWIALALAAAACAALLRGGDLIHRRTVASTLLATGASSIAVVWIHEPHLAAVTAAVLLGLGGVGLVLLGLVESRGELFTWGVAWLAVLVVTRYLDFVFAVDLGGPGFIGAGLLLMVVAWLVGRSRRLWSKRAEVVG